MTNYREILRLKKLGLNNSQIAQSLGCSRTTVIQVLSVADEKGISYKSNGTYHNINVISAAIRFAGSLARIFKDNYRKHNPEEDDIDKQLRIEIQAVKNGQNLVM